MNWLLLLQRLATLVTTVLPAGVVFAGCDVNSLQNCAHQLVNYERQVSAGLISYTESELEELCRRFDDIGVCVKRATSTCPLDAGLATSSSGGSTSASGPVAPSFDGHFMSTSDYKKKFWSGLESSFTFLCKHGKHTYLKHLQCFSAQPLLQSSIRFCNRTFHMNRAAAHTVDRTCSVLNEFLQCLRSVVRRHCGEEASRWQVTVVQRLRQPSVDAFGCKLGSHRLRPDGVLVVVSISALLSLLHPYRPFRRPTWA